MSAVAQRAASAGAQVKPEDNPESILYKPAGEQAQAMTPEPVSPTRVQLFIRPMIGKKFEISFSKFHEEIGIEHPRLSATSFSGSVFGLCHSDTTELIAKFEPNANHTWQGLTEVVVTIDPETCAVERSAAWRLRQALTKFAQAMGGVIYDGLDKEVSADALKSLTDHLHDTISRRCDEADEALDVQAGRYTVKRAGYLSYQYSLRTQKPGQRSPDLKRVYFEAPALPYHAGMAQGYRMALELVGYLKTHRNSDAALFQTLCEAGTMAQANRFFSYEGTRREHAAEAFLQCMVTLIKIGAGNLNMKWLEHKIATYDQYEAEHAPGRDAKKAAFVKRMQAAKAAKKAQREGGAA